MLLMSEANDERSEFFIYKKSETEGRVSEANPKCNYYYSLNCNNKLKTLPQ